MVLELLIYAKSAIKNFDQSEASIVVMWLSKEASRCLPGPSLTTQEPPCPFQQTISADSCRGN